MTLIAIDTVLRKLQVTTDIGSYDALFYSNKYCNYETPFPSLNYEHFIYRCLADNSYYVTKLDLLRGNHHSSPLTQDEKYPGELRPLYQHLWPELSV